MSHTRLARIGLLLAAIGLSATPALSYAQKDKASASAEVKDELRKDMYKLFEAKVVNEQMAAKNYAALKASVATAEAMPNLTDYEKYIINRVKVMVSSATNDEKTLLPALEASMSSGRLTKEEQVNFQRSIAGLYMNAKNYPKAIESFIAYQKISPTPGDVADVMNRAYFLNNDFAKARDGYAAIVKADEAAGKVPEEDTLRLWLSAVHKLKDQDAYSMIIEKLVTYHPSDDFWTEMLGRFQSSPKYKDRLDLDTLRLDFVAVSKLRGEAYYGLADRALTAGFASEAKEVIDAGYAAGEMGKGSDAIPHKTLRDKANKKAAEEAKTIAGDEASAAKAKDGRGYVNLGWTFVTLKQYDKGIEMIQKGIAKGGLPHPEDAKLRLGMAYAKAGKVAEATKALAEVGEDGGTKELAHYWSMWANRK